MFMTVVEGYKNISKLLQYFNKSMLNNMESYYHINGTFHNYNI